MPCQKHNERLSACALLCNVPSDLKLSHSHRRPLCSVACPADVSPQEREYNTISPRSFQARREGELGVWMRLCVSAIRESHFLNTLDIARIKFCKREALRAKIL